MSEMIFVAFTRARGRALMHRLGLRPLACSGLALLAAGCSAGSPAAELSGSQAEALVIPTVSAPCDIGVQYERTGWPVTVTSIPGDPYPLYDDSSPDPAGNWEEKSLVPGCMPATRFSFGAPSDVGLLFGQSIATYGVNPAGDRIGRFFIDRNNDNYWDAGDTYTRFMPNPQAGDQPFAMSINTKILSGGHCVSSSNLNFLNVVVGIKRGSAWYIDANNNGTWDGTGQCDIYVSSFGAPSDEPTPVPGMIGTARRGNASSAIEWFFDSNLSFSWNGAPPDSYLTAFGTGGMSPHSDSLSGTISVATSSYYNVHGDVVVDKNGNHVWDGTPTDVVASGFMNISGGEDRGSSPPIKWEFVGWFTARPPEPPPR